MGDSPNIDEPISSRRSIRSCRLSIVKPKPSVEVTEEKPVLTDAYIDQEDPPDTYQVGDIFWVHVSGNPWWPALIYGSYYEDYSHTKIFRIPRRPKKRLYFVYFFGPSFEYTWTHATGLVPYSGLDEFIRYAESAVQQGTTKKEQETIASRFELKVAANKRPHWDKAIAEADEALKLTREQRVENFDKLLKEILNKAEKNRTSKKRHSSTTTRELRKTLSPSENKPTNRSSVKRQKTKSTPASSSPALLHVGLPTLTKKEEKEIIDKLLEHPQSEQLLTLNEAQSFICQLVTDIIKENYHYEMSCIQIEWFYDFLLNHPEIVSKYSHWFNDDIKPIINDSIYLKQCQIKTMIENQME